MICRNYVLSCSLSLVFIGLLVEFIGFLNISNFLMIFRILLSNCFNWHSSVKSVCVRVFKLCSTFIIVLVFNSIELFLKNPFHQKIIWSFVFFRIDCEWKMLGYDFFHFQRKLILMIEVVESNDCVFRFCGLHAHTSWGSKHLVLN